MSFLISQKFALQYLNLFLSMYLNDRMNIFDRVRKFKLSRKYLGRNVIKMLIGFNKKSAYHYNYLVNCLKNIWKVNVEFNV